MHFISKGPCKCFWWTIGLEFLHPLVMRNAESSRLIGLLLGVNVVMMDVNKEWSKNQLTPITDEAGIVNF